MDAACLQLRVDHCQREDNIRRALKLAESALEMGATILVFPELFLTGFCYERFAQYSMPYPFLEPFRAFVKERGCLIIGSIIGDEYNLGFCLDSEAVQFRPKIHPFDKEKEYFQGGDFIAPVATKWGKVGLEVCYDLRFPEVARSLALQGADFLVTVAQFPAVRKAHWRTLCLARAIENQIPHIACNWSQGGGSMIIDAWGNVLAEAGQDETAIAGKIDLERRDQFRQEVTCFEDRRPEIY
ncbi:MAG: nitrilase-related carbon-nitrogen hydrolase [Methanotrichaceae archaeon]